MFVALLGSLMAGIIIFIQIKDYDWIWEFPFGWGIVPDRNGLFRRAWRVWGVVVSLGFTLWIWIDFFRRG